MKKIEIIPIARKKLERRGISEEWIKETINALIMDLTSLKKEPVEAMLKYSEAEVIGIHPLFGPRERSLRSCQRGEASW